MRRFMMLAGLALVASLVIGGAAAASASAVAPAITLTNASYPQPFTTSNNTTSSLSSTAGSVKCQSLTGKGLLWSATDALLLLQFHTCTDNLSNECSSAGEPKGLIHVLLLVKPVWLNRAQSLPGLLFEKHQGESLVASFSCGVVKVAVRGTVLGHITKPLPKVPSHTMEVNVLVKTLNTEQEFEKVEEGTAIDKLESSFTAGVFVKATEEVRAATVEFEKAGVEAEFN